MKPSILQWKLAGTMRQANALIRRYCGNDDRLAYIDVEGLMLGWDKTPRKDLFVKDGLHLTPKGYELWTVLVRPFQRPPLYFYFVFCLAFPCNSLNAFKLRLTNSYLRTACCPSETRYRPLVCWHPGILG